MVVETSGRTGTLRHPPRVSWTGSGDDQICHDLWLHLWQAQALKPPWHWCKIAHINRIIAGIPSRLDWNLELQGRDQYLLRPSLPTTLTETNNQEGPTAFDTSTRYMIWESGWTHSINYYFELYTQYRPLSKWDDTEANGIRGITNLKRIGTIILDLEYNKGKLQNLIFVPPWSAQAPHQPSKMGRNRGEDKVRREGTYLKVMGKNALYFCGTTGNNRGPSFTLWDALSQIRP